MSARPSLRVLAVFLLVSLCGCLEMEMQLRVEDDGGGEVTFLITMKKAFYEEGKKRGEDMKSPFEDIKKSPGLKVIEEKEYDSDKGHTWSLRGSFEDVRDLQTTSGEMKGGMAFRFEKAYKGLWTDYTLTVRQAGDSSSSETAGDPAAEAQKREMMAALFGGFKFTLQTALPGAIKEATDAVVTGSTAKWELDIEQMSKPREMTVRARRWNWLLVAALGGLIIAIGLFVVLKMSKGGSTARVRRGPPINPALLPPTVLSTPAPAPAPVPVDDLVRFACPSCSSRLTAKRASSGKRIACPKCKKPIAVP